MSSKPSAIYLFGTATFMINPWLTQGERILKSVVIQVPPSRVSKEVLPD
jgi:hypothetical protein